MKTIQTWNNVLSYIKMNLGVPLNMIELSDEDIINYLSEHTLVEFSNYVPKIKYYLLTEKDLVDEKLAKYKIDVDDYIIDVTDIYTYRYSSPSSISSVSPDEIIKTVIENKYTDMVKSLSSTITYKFEEPNYLIFYDSMIKSFLPAVVEYSTIYKNLSEIPADMYHYFKKLCLADIKILIGNMRTKYHLSTPIGRIDNNGEILKEEGWRLRQAVIENLRTLPPDKFIVFVN